jgi:amino acid adenylation domain-containing protein
MSSTSAAQIRENEDAAAHQFWFAMLGRARGHRARLVDLFGGARRRGGTTNFGFAVDGSAYERLSRLAGGGPFLVYTTAMAAMQLVLARYRQEGPAAAGSPLRRGEREKRRLRGILPIVIGIEEVERIDRLLLSVREALLEAYRHQAYPLTGVLADCGLSGPLCDVVLASPALHHDVTPPECGLIIEYEDAPGRLQCRLRAGNGFPEDAAQRVAEDWRDALAQMVESPRARPDAIAIGAGRERQFIGAEAVPALDPLEAGLVHERVANWARRAGTRAAVVDGGESVTYAELDRFAGKLAGRLRELGAGPERVVALHLPPGIDFVASALSVMKAGAAYLPLGSDLPAARVQHIIEDAGACAVVHSGGTAGYGRAAVDLRDEARIERCAPIDDRAGEPLGLAYVMYTSGSTGAPKGVAVTHLGLANLVAWHRGFHAVTEQDRASQVASLDFDAAVWEIWPYLSCGATLVVAPRDLRLEPAALFDWLRRERITRCFLPTPLAEAMLAEPVPEGLRLRTMLVGGDRLHRNPAATLPFEIVNHYGPTEATVVATCERLAREGDGADRPPAIGLPISNMRAYLLDNALRPTPAGVPGELYIAGIGVARGYLGQPRETAERFLPDPFGAAPGARMYHTGDRARRLSDGRLEFLGRSDHQVKIRGYRIETGEIEHALERHSAVRRAAVIAETGGPAGAFLAGYVEAADAARAGSEALERWRDLFDGHIYADPRDDGGDATFNITGWSSSLTGEPMPARDMREWVADAVRTVREFKPQSVYEIGCGTGLLLLPLAPECRKYVGSDFSRVALDAVEAQMRRLGGRIPQVELRLHHADDFSRVGVGEFDTVILNSVVQYFPTLAYWMRVLESVERSVAAGGRVFIGDVRSLPLLGAFAAECELRNAADGAPVAQLLQGMEARMAHDNELIFAPEFFHALCARFARIDSVEIRPKRGRCRNELTAYRYQVVLGIEGRPERHPASSVEWADWRAEGDGIAALERRLKLDRPELLAFGAVPNARVARAAVLAKLLSEGNASTAEDVRREAGRRAAEGVDPQDFWDLEALGYEVDIGWGRHGSDGAFDVLLRRRGSARPMPRFPQPPAGCEPEEYVASPRHHRSRLEAEIRGHLEELLPRYMVPSSIVVLDRLPVTPRGKIDREALHALARDGQQRTELAAEPPATATERAVAAMYAELLGGAVGRQDSFFERGGHSLLATQLVSRIRSAFAVDLPLRALFETPRVDDLCRRIDELQLAQGADAKNGKPIPAALVARPRPARIPLSFAQQRLWFLNRLEPASAAYHIPSAVRLRGDLDVDALARTLDAILARHEALRTTFTEIEGEPVQVIHDATPLPLPVIDLEPLGSAAAEAELQRLIHEDVHRLFDLRQGPLVRASLVRLGAREHALLLTMHHIVSDGWSMGVLVRELKEGYAARRAGRAAALEPLPVQYADFTLWQRERLSGPAIEGEIAHWAERLRDLPPLELPADLARSGMAEYDGGMRVSEFPEELAAGLETLGGRQGATLFMSLLAVFQTLLHRQTGAVDFAVGCPIANRQQKEIEPLIGFFVNTLVMRADLSGDPCFRELLDRVRQTTLDAYGHQDLPFERLVEALQPERVPGRNPLFQVLFALHNVPAPEPELPGLELAPMEIRSRATRFDLEMHMWRRPGGLLCVTTYSTARFSPAAIERFLAQFARLGQAATEQPELPVSRLAMSDADERARIAAWQSGPPLPAVRPSLYAGFAAQAEATPRAAAIIAGGEAIDYATLEKRARAVAAAVCARGIGRGSRVGICVSRGPALVPAMLGVLAAGAAYVPLDPAYPRDRLRFMVEDAGADLILTSEETAGQIADAGIPALDVAEALQHDGAPEPVPMEDTDLAYIIYTSGSTGRPKGVAIPHGAAAAYLAWAGSEYGKEVMSGGVLAGTSICFDLSIYELFLPLHHGGTVVLVQDVLALGDLKDTERVTVLSTVPSAMATLLEMGVVPRTVRVVTLGGEVLPAELADAVYRTGHVERLYDIYGPTEDTTCSTFARRVPGGAVTIGRPVGGSRVYLLDDRLEPVASGAAGDIYLGGIKLALGYYGRSRETAERFLPDPFAEAPGARMYRTGDRARYLPDGNLQYLGRLDSQVKVRGYRIELAEVEATLGGEEVRETAAVAGDGRLDAWIVPSLRKDDALRGAHIAAWARVFDTLEPAGAEGEDFSGWISSYTGKPIPPEEMHESADGAAAQVLAFAPRRVLEIGSSAGHTLFRVAPHVERYIAHDVSAVSNEGLARAVEEKGLSGRVSVRTCGAEDLSDIAPGSLDMVILNSVIQYFPDLEYLLRVLDAALTRLTPRGRIFLGDVRSLPLEAAFHTSVQFARADDDIGMKELRRRIAAAIAREPELLVDPALFTALARRHPMIGGARLLALRGRARNELTCFRYQAILELEPPELPEPARFDWVANRLSPAGIERYVRTMQPQAVRVASLPNQRLAEVRRLMELLSAAADEDTVGTVRARLAQPAHIEDDVWRLALAGYRIDCEWPDHALDASLTLCVDEAEGASAGETFPAASAARATASAPDLAREFAAYATDPLAMSIQERAVAAVRRRLEARLPGYMVPYLHVVPALPRLPNGKVDRVQLRRSAPAGADGYKPGPRTPTERRLARLWIDLLRVEQVSPSDNFFALGGHSLLAASMMAAIRSEMHLDLPLRAVFEAPTLAALAARIDAPAAPVATVEPVPHARQPGAAPLTAAQRRLWFLSELRPDAAFYNLPVALRLRGALDDAALGAAVDALAQRHEPLRTRFVAPDGEPWAVVDFPPRGLLQILDLGQVPAGERIRAAIDAVEAEAARPFDLAATLPFRAVLLRLASDDHILLLTAHHIVSDGWSTGVLLRDLGALYHAIAGGGEPRLRPIEVTYADFAHWSSRGAEGPDRLARGLEYWRGKLAGAPVLGLPADHPRPAVPRFAGHLVELRIPRADRQALARLAANQGATLFAALLAVFCAFLRRQTGQSDLVVGTPVANRPRRELEDLVGLFVDTVVLRIDAGGNPSMAELTGRARDTALEAFEHAHVGFEAIVDALQPDRDVARNPLFQTMFAYHNLPMALPVLDGLETAWFPYQNYTTRFDLEVHIWDDPEGLRGTLVADADLFDRRTAERLAEGVRAMAAAVAARPESSIGDLAGVDAGAGRVAGETVAEVPDFLSRIDFESSAAALRYGDEEIAYRELGARSARLASRLRNAGAGLEVRVGLALPASLDLAIASVATLMAGGTCVPIELALPEARRVQMLERAGVSLVIGNGPEARAMAGGRTYIDLHAPDANAGDATLPACIPADPEAPAYVLFTSGSTGVPKGVAMPRRALSNLVDWQLRAAPAARTLQYAQPGFDVWYQEVFSTLCAGSVLVVAPPEMRADFDTLADLIDEQAIERVFLPVPAFEELSRALVRNGAPPRALRHVITAGELENQYGPTETHVVTACRLPRDPAQWEALPPIGLPIANTRCYVLDGDRRPLPDGVAGELYISGDALARGYADAPGATAERFVPDPFSSAGARMYSTGDLVRRLGTGELQFLGRNDRQIKLRGYRIEPGEVETVLARHPDVQGVAVDVFGTGRQARLGAWVVTSNGATSQSLLEFARAHLPMYLCPSFVNLVDALPLTVSGKLDRRRLPAPASPQVSLSPRTRLERLVAAAWRETLGLPDGGVDRNANFFDSGGDSLAIVRLRNALERSMGRRLKLMDLFRRPSIAAQALWLEIGEEAGDSLDGASHGADRNRRRARLRQQRQEG